MFIYYFIIVVLSFSSIFFFQKIFFSNKLYDDINNRSSHTSIATRSGGISIFSTIFILSFYSYIKGIEIYDFSLIVPLSILVSIGLYDDIYKLDFKLKFIFQIIAAKIIIDNGLIIDNLHGFFGIYEIGRLASQVLTIFIIVSIINAINFIDGIDGLAISVILIFLIGFEFFASSQTPLFKLTVISILSIIPLIYFNFKKDKKVFLGDSGSLFLGGLVSIYVIYILTNEYIIKEQFDVHKILFVFSILSYPIIDIVRVVFNRILNGRSPFLADKNHIHHKILKNTKSHLSTTILISLVSMFLLILIQIIF